MCRPSISDNFNSDMEGRVACCEEAMGSETRHTLFCVAGRFVRVAKTACFPQRNGGMLYALVECTNSHLLRRRPTLLLRDGSMVSLWELDRHLQLPSVQVLWCGNLRWTLTHFGRCVHAERGCLIHVVLMSVDSGCVSVDVWPTIPDMSLMHATH